MSAFADRRRSPQAHPARRDGARRRRRGPRERGRPHDGGRVGHRRRRSTSCCAGPAGSCACRSTRARLDELDVPPMVARTAGTCDTAFSVSIDHVGAGSGIGAADRAHTIRKILDPSARARRLHPARVTCSRCGPAPGGVLERRGHTEAAVDLARLAGLAAGRGDLRGAARRRLARPACRSSSCSRQEHRIAMISVDQVAEHRLAARPTPQPAASARLLAARVRLSPDRSAGSVAGCLADLAERGGDRAAQPARGVGREVRDDARAGPPRSSSVRHDAQLAVAARVAVVGSARPPTTPAGTRRRRPGGRRGRRRSIGACGEATTR